jgi:Histidine acid phosphatase.
MVQLGSRIRDELHQDVDNDEEEEGKDNDNDDDEKRMTRLFTHTDPIHPSKVKIKSTNFPRTIQSVQALLLGLFPLGYDGEIEIDASETDVLIPDPQPRLSVEQVELERELSRRSHIVEREEELEELAGKITDSLHYLIDWEHASGMSWGIGEEKEEEEDNVDRRRTDSDGILNDSSSSSLTTTTATTKTARSRRKWLTFSQLAEVMTCLRVRDKLPESISHEDYKIIASHSAWKWFENLRNDNLARLAMKSFMNLIMETLRDGLDENSKDPVLYIYSCHDSSLIGLMCAFRLEQPAEWPEYGSYLKVELFKAQEEEKDNGEVRVDYYVRFSLNGQVLKSSWGMEREGPNKEVPREMICLKHLSRSIAREHGHPCIIEERTGKS